MGAVSVISVVDEILKNLAQRGTEGIDREQRNPSTDSKPSSVITSAIIQAPTGSNSSGRVFNDVAFVWLLFTLRSEIH